ncbi:MAG: glycosyltransferase family 4 protein [Chloroflexota bacterium]
MTKPKIGILHYTVPPVVGGVEAVIQAQAGLLSRLGYPVTVIAGRGEVTALPPGVEFVRLPKVDSQNEEILQMNASLEQGKQYPGFEALVEELAQLLQPVLVQVDHLIVHNVFTKHFNLALTVALQRLIALGVVRHTIAWCHDASWTSPSSRAKVYAGYPWDVLRTKLAGVTYVTVSVHRQKALAALFACDIEDVHVVYNGVDLASLLNLCEETMALAARLGLPDADVVLLMPVRVTRAKNIEFALNVLAALAQRWRAKLVLTGPPDPHDPESMAYFASLQEMSSALGVGQDTHFVFSSGPDPNIPYWIGERVVGDLYRLSDVMFMPSHREGFGMPVLEAGLAGIPVVCAGIPAAQEIGGADVTVFRLDETPERVAALIVERLESSPLSRFRRRVRQAYTWEALFRRKIEPLLTTHG